MKDNEDHHGHTHASHEHQTHADHAPSPANQSDETAPGLTYYGSPSQNGRRPFTLTTPLALIISAIIIAGGLVGYGLVSKSATVSGPITMFMGKPIDDTDFVEGAAKSDVILVEYSDSECPFCVQVHPTIKKLRTSYEDKVAFVYRHFPLTQIHPHAYDEARAIACAGKIGGAKKFYEYIDSIFGYKIDHKTTQLPTTGKEDIARSVGLDPATFISCMNKGDTKQTVDNSIADGVAAGVQGTPASFVLLKTKKGYEVIGSIDGARPYEYFKAMIDQALAR